MTAAAACNEVEADLGEGDGLCSRKAAAVVLPLLLSALDIEDDPEIDREGGSEFRSGAMGALLYG